MRTYTAKPNEIERKWYVVDAEGKPLGRLASQVAKILRGKHKPIFTPHVDTGDHVIIINADKVKLTGRGKPEAKIYRHTQYPGGIRSTTYGKMLEDKPEGLITRVVKGMLPHNSLGASMLKKLKVYRGAEHPHAAQQPEVLEILEDKS
ncbi:MAG: 50S ribosomal protein L13 [Armatimonadetes bacterium]|nr:50S ribosomal protein L13 [Armatimonadota bacterium]